jgi:SAM-dependent methyltransferase
MKGDAINLPFSDASLDVVVSRELVEHLDTKEKMSFLQESSRALKVGGLFIMSTPNADYLNRHSFWLPELSRKIIPKRWRSRLPLLLRGPWLDMTIEEWEIKVGHYERGCKLNHIRSISKAEGFEELDHRFMHTSLTSFWLQLMLTFPLIFIILIPLVQLFYFIESKSNKEDGASFLIAFRKIGTFT